MSRLTLYNYLILGLVNVRPHSGYSLASAIRETPMSALSDSPGAVYPALKKLERLGLIKHEVTGGKVRKRKQYAISRRGADILKDWLDECPDALAVLQQPAVLVLKLAFGSDEQIRRTLRALNDSVHTQLTSLAKFGEISRAHMPAGPKLATDFSISLLGALGGWCKEQLKPLD